MSISDMFRKEMNFRDLGGYISADHRKIRPGILYRSAALGLLNEDEKLRFPSLGIRTILDFRTEKASRKLPDPTFEGAEQIRSCAAFEDLGDDLNDSPMEFLGMLVDEDQTGNAVDTVVSSIHSALVYTNDAYKEMFRLLLEHRTPLLFHCSQGKDRTGIGAVLIMLALGIDEEQIKKDYVLSNEYRSSFIEKRLESMGFLPKISSNVRSAVLAVEGVLPEAIHMLLCEIRERYQTYENFLLQEYGLTEENLKDLRDYYLE